MLSLFTILFYDFAINLLQMRRLKPREVKQATQSPSQREAAGRSLLGPKAGAPVTLHCSQHWRIQSGLSHLLLLPGHVLRGLGHM